MLLQDWWHVFSFSHYNKKMIFLAMLRNITYYLKQDVKNTNQLFPRGHKRWVFIRKSTMFLNSVIMICSQDTALQGIYIDPASEDFSVQFSEFSSLFFSPQWELIGTDLLHINHWQNLVICKYLLTAQINSHKKFGDFVGVE